MKSDFSGLPVIFADELASTNNYATSLISSGKVRNETLIWTFRQTQGRGHGKNVWESEDYKDLTFSLVLYPTFLPASGQFLLSQVVSLGLTGFLSSETAGAEIKWPNDILVNRKKVAGILIENHISGSNLATSVIGIGMNINQQSFPDHLPHATSLSLISKKEFDLEDTLGKILSEIMKWYRMLQKEEYTLIRENYLKHLAGMGKTTTFKKQDGLFEAEIRGIDPYGQLLLKHKDGTVEAYPFKSVEMVFEWVVGL